MYILIIDSYVHVHVDMFAVPEDEIKSKCEGADVFFCCLGTTRRAAGSAVSHLTLLKLHCLILNSL